jgi:hypothetical protein
VVSCSCVVLVFVRISPEWIQARHQICTVDENPIMERNDEYSKRYVG